ncbi:MAG: hypothetical protein Q8R28_16390, partial [Dehalococcoidia bacterium]|nr:hypothetical protein [Dehalococcoidia bacterium]
PAAPAPTPTTAPAATAKPAAAAPAPTATSAPKKLGKIRYGGIQPAFSVPFFDMDIEKGFL